MRKHFLYLYVMNFTIKTIGCKVNTYESNKIRDDLIKSGFNYIDVDKKDEYKNLDFYIVNTCSVTSIADKKSRQMLHLAKKYNPDVKVIAIGCLVDSCDSLDGVDYKFSNSEKLNFPSFLSSIADNDIVPSAINYRVSTTAVRAFIKIQDGCDEYCTYCLIPYLRGHIKSREENDIIEDILDYIKKGTKEIVLTGIHLSSYGLDRKKMSYESDNAINESRKNILSLTKKIADLKVLVDGVEKEILRIRFGSLEPRIIDERFLETLKNDMNNKFCPNFCLSLQSGSDKILKLMNRHYTTKDFENACKLIRKYMPDATITTDIIVGFPGETEEDFNDSLNFVKKIRFYNPNVFPYSKRMGTKAASFDGQLTNSEKHERSVVMIKECDEISRELEKELMDGKVAACDIDKSIVKNVKVGNIIDDVLIEEIVENEDGSFAVGYTKNYIRKKIKI